MSPARLPTPISRRNRVGGRGAIAAPTAEKATAEEAMPGSAWSWGPEEGLRRSPQDPHFRPAQRVQGGSTWERAYGGSCGLQGIPPYLDVTSRLVLGAGHPHSSGPPLPWPPTPVAPHSSGPPLLWPPLTWLRNSMCPTPGVSGSSRGAPSPFLPRHLMFFPHQDLGHLPTAWD